MLATNFIDIIYYICSGCFEKSIAEILNILWKPQKFKFDCCSFLLFSKKTDLFFKKKISLQNSEWSTSSTSFTKGSLCLTWHERTYVQTDGRTDTTNKYNDPLLKLGARRGSITSLLLYILVRESLWKLISNLLTTMERPHYENSCFSSILFLCYSKEIMLTVAPSIKFLRLGKQF